MWCQLKMSSNKSYNIPLVWQMGLWSMKTYVPLQVIQRLSVNWQSKKKNINRTGHPSYVLSAERKANMQTCLQLYQGRASPVCQSHITRPGRHDTDEEREPENWTKVAKTHAIRHSYSHWSGIAAIFIGEQVLSQKYEWPLPMTEMERSRAIQLASV